MSFQKARRSSGGIVVVVVEDVVEELVEVELDVEDVDDSVAIWLSNSAIRSSLEDPHPMQAAKATRTTPYRTMLVVDPRLEPNLVHSVGRF